MFHLANTGQPTKLPALMALIHVDFTGYPHAACISQNIYTVSLVEDFLGGALVAWPLLCTRGMQYRVPDANEDEFSFACYLHICFIVDSDTIVHETGDCVVVG